MLPTIPCSNVSYLDYPWLSIQYHTISVCSQHVSTCYNQPCVSDYPRDTSPASCGKSNPSSAAVPPAPKPPRITEDNGHPPALACRMRWLMDHFAIAASRKRFGELHLANGVVPSRWKHVKTFRKISQLYINLLRPPTTPKYKPHA